MSDPFIPGYEKAAADPAYPVITKDDYIGYLEGQLAAVDVEKVRRSINKATRLLAEAHMELLP